MYYIRHFYIYPYDETLKTILESEYNVSCSINTDPTTGKEKAFAFEISDLHPRIHELNRLLPPETPEEELSAQLDHRAVAKLVLVSYHPQYTKSELQSAKWLIARNINSKVMPVNCETVDGVQCYVKNSKIGTPLGRHEVQNEPYVIKSPVKWGRNAFVSAYCHEERLFCNAATREILTSQQLSGFQFLPVLKKSTMSPMDDIYQLRFTHTVSDDSIISITGMEEYVCDKCGMHMLRYGDRNNRFGLLSDKLDESIDFWQTQPMFLGGAPAEAVRGQRQLIISQKAYRILCELQLDRGFVFEPLELVNAQNMPGSTLA